MKICFEPCSIAVAFSCLLSFFPFFHFFSLSLSFFLSLFLSFFLSFFLSSFLPFSLSLFLSSFFSSFLSLFLPFFLYSFSAPRTGKICDMCTSVTNEKKKKRSLISVKLYNFRLRSSFGGFASPPTKRKLAAPSAPLEEHPAQGSTVRCDGSICCRRACH